MNPNRICLALLVACLVLPEAQAADAPATQPNQLFVAVGYGGRRMSSHDGLHWENDVQWSDKAADDDNVLFNVAFGQGKFIAVGGAGVGHILMTRDGKEWRETQKQKGRVATVAFGNNRFVAGWNDQFLYSTDGEDWKQGTKLGIEGSVHFRKSAFGNGLFVAIGDWDPPGKKRISFRAATADGEKLTHVDGTVAAARGIAFGAGRFVVVGPEALRESSTDGKTWEHPVKELDSELDSIIFDGKLFIAAGGKYAYTSPDGIEWKKLDKPIPCSVLYGNDRFHLGGSWGGNVWMSENGSPWKKIGVPTGNAFEAIAVGTMEVK